MIPAIDSHHHFWRYDAAEYSWIGEAMETLRLDFMPADLQQEMQSAGVEGAVSVQARQSLVETDWLLSLASSHSFLKGVVGWVPLVDPDVQSTLDRYAAHPKLKGVRHVIQDEPDNQFILRDDFNRGVAKLLSPRLVYDILIYERHLPQAIQFVDRHPEQVFVVDHIAKPCISARELDPWATRIGELAKRENVYCKVSGMATEADWRNWSAADLKPYFDVVLNAFQPRRLMFGTDWPVSLLAGDYSRWAATVREWVSPLSEHEQRRVLRETAVEVYRL